MCEVTKSYSKSNVNKQIRWIYIPRRSVPDLFVVYFKLHKTSFTGYLCTAELADCK